MDETNWINRAVQGDMDAFNQLVLLYQDRVFNLAYRITGHYQVAEDIAQETFLTAFIKLHTYRGGSFKSWLFRIASNLCYDQFRRDKSRPTTPLEPLNEDGDEMDSSQWMVDPSPSPSSLYERTEFWGEIQQFLNRLAPEYRMAVTLVDIQELGYAEAAAAMGVSLGTMKSRLVRGRVKLREMIRQAASSRTEAVPSLRTRPSVQANRHSVYH
jgi:RNA polymerase sigma-70 factor, ECF subfamily